MEFNDVQKQAISNVESAGLIVPYALDIEDFQKFSDENQFPLDVTILSPKDLGQKYSFWTAMHGRAQTTLGIFDAGLLVAEAAFDHYYHQAFVTASEKLGADGKRRLKECLVADAMADDKTRDWNDDKMIKKATRDLVKNIVLSYKGYVECLSREITRRDQEMRLSVGKFGEG